MLVWSVWCYPDTCLELLKVIWSWAVFPDVGINHADMGQLRGLIDLAGWASCLAHLLYRRKELDQFLQDLPAAARDRRAFETVAVDERHGIEMKKDTVEDAKRLCGQLNDRAPIFNRRQKVA